MTDTPEGWAPEVKPDPTAQVAPRTGVATIPTSNLPAQAQDDPNFVPGLEDFDTSTIQIPMLRLHGPTATFVDGLTEEHLDKVTLVILGLNLQRVLWPPEMSEEKRGPLCRSLNGWHGTPDLEKFPWRAAKLNSKLFIGTEDDPETGEEVKSLKEPIPCVDCKLKEWDTHPKGTHAPWCAEQYVFAALLRRETPEGELWTPTAVPFSKSGITPAKAYVTGYRLTNQPMFVDYTEITLKAEQRGTVDYAIPKFRKLGKTDPKDKGLYTDEFYRIRAWLQTPRGEQAVGGGNEEAQAPTVPAQRGASAAADPLDEPF